MHWSALLESARVGTDGLRANPLRTLLATTGVVIGVAALVAAFAITDGVAVWSRALILRESSVQDVTVVSSTADTVNGRRLAVHGAPVFGMDDASSARLEIPGVVRSVLTLGGAAQADHLGRRTPVQLTLSTAELADFSALPIEAVDTLRDATLDWLAERYGRNAEKLRVGVANQQLANTRMAMLLTKLLLGMLVGLILAVGGIGIMNVLLAAVVERTREIGVLKAVGARARDIEIQFLVESVTVTGAGAVIGFVLGVVLAFTGTAVFRHFLGSQIYPVVSPGTAVLAVASSVTVGLVFGTYPARRAARLSPIDAIARE